jgi:hypothetical protein
MERERQSTPRPESNSGDPALHENLDGERARLLDMFDKADQLLDSIRADQAEEYLQQSRQRGAQ